MFGRPGKGDSPDHPARAPLPPPRAWLAWLAALLACLATPAALAQVDLLGNQPAPGGFISEVGVDITSVGLNNAARPGEWTGIRVRLTDRGDSQREVLVRVVLTDVDGDDALYETVATTNPGIPQPVWLYARLPFDIAGLGGFEVRVLEAEEAPAGGPEIGFVATRLLGQASFTWPGSAPGRTTGLIGVVGRTPGGLTGYQQGGLENINPLGHEVTQIAPLTVDDLPDRWMGLAMVRELVWNGPSPAELRIDQVQALREWVQRGGHLLVILPATGQDWLALGNRELASILPRVVVNRVENEPASAFRALLTDEPPDALALPPFPVTFHTLEPLAEAAPGEADPILADAQGRVVVVSRAVGVGAVTMIGLPGWHSGITNLGLPETDVFWHRVLGRRGKVATDTEMQELQQRSMLFGAGRPSRTLDADISGVLSKSGRSLIAVLLGLVVFVAYWLVAGPGGFALLRTKGLSRHAWLAFLGASLVFTALAWTGATILRPKRVELSHLSFVDHVFGQRVQRVRSWASVLIPVYGEATLRLGSDDADTGGVRFQQAVAPWEPSQTLARGSFPDARPYSIDARSPDSITFPARSTVKQVQLDWAGGLAWESISPVVEPDGDPFRALRFSPPGDQQSVVRGSLVHNLPGVLESVQIVVVREQRDLHRLIPKDGLLSNAYAWYQGDWAPGVPLDLGAITSPVQSDLTVKLNNVLGGNAFGADDQPAAGGRIDRYQWLAFFNLFAPPERRGAFNQPPVARRDASHTLDLSRWATRPSLIVIGVLRVDGVGSMPIPVGVSTNGTERDAYASGLTIVRWVYPLPPAPPPVPTLPQDMPPETAPGPDNATESSPAGEG